MRITDSGKIFKIILFILVLGFFYYRFTVGLNSYLLHQDEHDFVTGSRLFNDFFLRRDLSSKDWQEIALDQPPLAYYIYGLTLYLGGHKNLAGEQEKIGFNIGYLDKAVLGWSTEQLASLEPWWVRLQDSQDISNLPSVLLPSFKMIWQAKKTAAVFSLGCLPLIYFLGLEIGGFLTGILSMLILGFNQLMFLTGRQAMADSILLFFLLANVLLIIYTLKFFYKKQALEFLGSTFLIGVNIALATSTKLNGGITFFIWGLAALLALISVLIKKKGRVEEALLLVNGFLISIIIASNLFVFLNPYLYPDPISRGINMVEHRISVSKFQQQYFQDALTSFPEKTRAVLNHALLSEGDWNNFEIPFLDLPLFLFGFALITTRAIKKFVKNITISPEIVIIVWILITFLALVSYIPLNWDRYYLPVIPCIAIAQAYAINRVGEFILLRLKGGYSR